MFLNTKPILTVLVVLSGLVTAHCSSGNQSAREARREQIRSQAETKRLELQQVTGEYRGDLQFTQALPAREVSLILDIQETPQDDGGSIDPVLVPQLKGAVRFPMGDTYEGESIRFVSSAAEYDAKLEKITLVLKNDAYHDLALTLTNSDHNLDGTWSSSEYGLSGGLSLMKPTPALAKPLTKPVKGTYRGTITRLSDATFIAPRGTVTINLSQDSSDPRGVSFSGSLRLYLGNFDSIEYREYPFTTFNYNVYSGEFSAKASGEQEFNLKGVVRDGTLNTALENGLGTIGKFEGAQP